MWVTIPGPSKWARDNDSPAGIRRASPLPPLRSAEEERYVWKLGLHISDANGPCGTLDPGPPPWRKPGMEMLSTQSASFHKPAVQEERRSIMSGYGRYFVNMQIALALKDLFCVFSCLLLNPAQSVYKSIYLERCFVHEGQTSACPRRSK